MEVIQSEYRERIDWAKTTEFPLPMNLSRELSVEAKNAEKSHGPYYLRVEDPPALVNPVHVEYLHWLMMQDYDARFPEAKIDAAREQASKIVRDRVNHAVYQSYPVLRSAR